MANSIAKLAVIFTSNTSGLAKGAQQAAGIVSGANAKMAGSFGGIGTASTAAGVAIGSLASAGVMALARLAKEAAKFSLNAAVEFRNARIEILKEYDRLIGKNDEFRQQFGATNEGITANLERLKNSVGAALQPVEYGIGKVAGAAANLVEKISAKISGDGILKAASDFDKLRKQVEAAAQAEKDAAAKRQDAADKARRQIESMQSAAESLTQSLRTPAEVYADTMAELNKLTQRGLISMEVFQRGAAKARRDLMQVEKASRALPSGRSLAAGAVERFTTAGFSAVSQGREELNRIANLSKQQTDVLRKQEILLVDANAKLQKLIDKPGARAGGL